MGMREWWTEFWPFLEGLYTLRLPCVDIHEAQTPTWLGWAGLPDLLRLDCEVPLVRAEYPMIGQFEGPTAIAMSKTTASAVWGRGVLQPVHVQMHTFRALHSSIGYALNSPTCDGGNPSLWLGEGG